MCVCVCARAREGDACTHVSMHFSVNRYRKRQQVVVCAVERLASSKRLN
jgi:hypothetical protein